MSDKETSNDDELLEKLVGMISEMRDGFLSKPLSDLQKKAVDIGTKKDIEIIQTIYQGLRTRDDRAIHMSDLQKIVKNLISEKSPPTKRVKTIVKEASPQGLGSDIEIGVTEEMWEKLKKKRGLA